MKEAYDLIRQQKLLLEQMSKLFANTERVIEQKRFESPDSKDFVKDIYRDEIRNNFLVTTDRKKLWNVEISVAKELERICKKHNIKYFANFGTLLGAVRHKGFVPWDDDMDFIMFRPEWEKFKKVVAEEVAYPYSIDFWYNHRLEGEEDITPKDEQNFPLVTKEMQQKCPGWWPCFPLIRLIDERTTMIAPDSSPNVPDVRRNLYKGIFVEIFPIDPVPPFKDEQAIKNFQIAKELLMAVTFAPQVKQAIQAGQKFFINTNDLERFLKLSYRQRALYWESFMLQNYFESEYVGNVRKFCICSKTNPYEMKDFEETLYLPFEKVELPCPVGAEKILSADYGDWHQMIFTHSCTQEYSADIPYTEYFKNLRR